MRTEGNRPLVPDVFPMITAEQAKAICEGWKLQTGNALRILLPDDDVKPDHTVEG